MTPNTHLYSVPVIIMLLLLLLLYAAATTALICCCCYCSYMLLLLLLLYAVATTALICCCCYCSYMLLIRLLYAAATALICYMLLWRYHKVHTIHRFDADACVSIMTCSAVLVQLVPIFPY